MKNLFGHNDVYFIELSLLPHLAAFKSLGTRVILRVVPNFV